MVYAILMYAVMTIALVILFRVHNGIRRLEKIVLLPEAFIAQNKRHLEVMEKQLEVSQEENIAGKMVAEQMIRMNDKLDLMDRDCKEGMDLLRREMSTVQEELQFIKMIVLDGVDLNDKSLDHQVVQNMRHEIVVTTEESDGETV